jgi:small conductance mechanosensitive channel
MMTDLASTPHELNTIATMFWAWAVEFIPRIASAGLVFIVGYLAAKWAGRLLSGFLVRTGRIDATYIPSIRSVVSYAILIFVVVATLAQLGVQTASILAALGAAGLAIGLALQGTLANIAAGIILLWLRPFRAGEYISVDTTEGTVREIGLFATLLDAPDGSFRFVPNSQLWNKPLANLTRNPRRLVDIRVTVGRGSDVEKARQLILDVAKSDRRVMASPAPTVSLAEIGETTIVLAARAWTASADYAEALRDMLEGIQRQLDRSDLLLPKAQPGEPAKATIAAMKPK